MHPESREAAPASGDWIYELKMDGYRLMVRRIDDKVRIYSRRGDDFTPRFPRIVEAVRRLKLKSCCWTAKASSTTRTACRAST
jgi:ATP-dependent DNA ligase